MIKTIYKITNIVNEKSYIGKTVQDFEWYSSNHLNRALREVDVKFDNPRAFYNAIRKYGKDKFKRDILWQGECSDDWLNELEKYYIYFYDSFGKNGYNMTIGGDGFNSENHILKGKCRSKEHCRKLSEYHRNKKLSEKTKNKISKATKGKNNPMYGRKRTGTNAGRKRKYLLISPNRQLIGSYGNLYDICEKYGILYTSIKNRINKGVIKDGKTRKFKNRNIIGWEVLTV